MQASKQVVNKW